MTTFSWLHLTDLHYGIRDQEWLWPQFKEKFFDDLKLLHDKHGPWDFVIFTGDITNRGTIEEFQGVENFLNELWGNFKMLGFSPKLLVVPGNHDLKRNNKPSSVITLLKEWQKRPDLQDEFWVDEQSEYRQYIKDIFKNYLTWMSKNKLIVNDLISGILPGDFSVTIEKNGAKLGIVGLNTSFLHFMEGDCEGKLAIHTKQFQAVCLGDGPSWVKKHHVCILLTHHPSKWLDDGSQEHFHREISSNGRFVVHLCGHNHVTRLSESSEGGTGEIQRFWQGRSLFGLDRFLDKDGKEISRSHGYTVGSIELNGQKGKLLFWPRQAVVQGNERNIIQDSSIKMARGKECTKPIYFELHQPYKGQLSKTSWYKRHIDNFSMKLSSLIKDSVCKHQRQIVEYVFEATAKHINIQQNLNANNTQNLYEICRDFDIFLMNRLRKAFVTTQEQLQNYYNLRDNHIYKSHRIKPRLCFKSYRNEDKKIHDVFRNFSNPFLINNNTGFIEVNNYRKFYISYNIPKEAKDRKYKNSRLKMNMVDRYTPYENEDYFENGNDTEWQSCWKGYKKGNGNKVIPESCYKSTLIIPISLVYEHLSEFVLKRLKIDESFDGTLFGYLCLDHQCQEYFSENMPDVDIGYILADMLSFYIIARISYRTSVPYKEAVDKLKENNLFLEDSLYRNISLVVK